MEAGQFDTNYIDAELQKLSSVLKKDVEFFIAGGFVMATLDLKVGTKDLDVVTKSEEDTRTLIDALIEMGYCPLRTEVLEGAYRSLAAKYCQNADGFRRDIFTLRIADKLELSSGMIDRSEEYFGKGKLKIYVLSKEYVFLLKYAFSLFIMEEPGVFPVLPSMIHKIREPMTVNAAKPKSAGAANFFEVPPNA
jgi:hypothetical protein